MVLKLKDWPPGEDFRDMMPSRYEFPEETFTVSVVHPIKLDCRNILMWYLPQLWAAVGDMWTDLFLRDASQREILHKFHDKFLCGWWYLLLSEHLKLLLKAWITLKSEVQLRLTFWPNIFKYLDLGWLIFLEMIAQQNSFSPEQLHLFAVFLCLFCLVPFPGVCQNPLREKSTLPWLERAFVAVYLSGFGFIST